MIRIIIKVHGCDINTGDFEGVKTVLIESEKLEKALNEPWGKAWVIGAEIVPPDQKDPNA